MVRLLFDQVIVPRSAVMQRRKRCFARRAQGADREACKESPACIESRLRYERIGRHAISRYEADAVLRGLRAFSDFEYELQMALMNRSLRRQCETIFMMPTLKNSFVASRLVKEVAQLGGDYHAYVPPVVHDAVARKIAAAKGGEA